MRGKICYAPDGVALYFDVRTEHLTDEWFQPTEPDDEQFVVGCGIRWLDAGAQQ